MGVATFASYLKSANVTLSNGDLTATVTSGGGNVRTFNRFSGPTYYEMVVNTLTTAARVGIAGAEKTTTSNQLGTSSSDLGYVSSSGAVLLNNVTLATLATYTAGACICVAVDMVNQKVWFRINNGNWNNDVIANQNPATNTGGLSLSGMTMTLCAAFSGTTSSVTANFSAASWLYSPPSGFSSMEVNQAIPRNSAVANAATYTVLRRANGPGIPQTCKPFTLLQKAESAWFNSPVFSEGPVSTAVSGQIQENGVPVAGKKAFLYDRRTGEYLGSAISDGSGNFSIEALGRASTFVVSVDAPYNAIVFDNIVPL